jgi:ribonucleoside-diphosphate reductase beta chain
MSVFAKTKQTHLDQPLFLGEPVDVSRFDKIRLPWLDRFTDRQLSFFWRPEEVDVTRDSVDFKERMTDAERHMFTSNLKYQILLDSVQGRSPNLAFLPIISLPEAETWIETWAFIETIHSRSYTHIIRNVYPEPGDILDHITDVDAIVVRAQSVTEEYDKLIDMGKQATPTQVIRTLLSVYALEAIRFYVSFACSFSFAERKLMEGNAKIIKFIARDEALHMSATQLMLNHIFEGNEGPEWQAAALAQIDWMLNMFDEVVSQEKAWADYLFSKGSIIGLNGHILGEYVEYIANTRIGALGFGRDRYPVKVNPLPWINTWLSSDTVQVAPQEVELSSYLTGAIDTKVSTSDLDGLSL